ncbi:hypothetical protein TRFO_19142 [Tritrichomonas foetus]|uniref:FHA domain-containing protein n=1 Tax=Tritrichomonas foetus TaxID=1144522 RepID=A0A1J4KJM0_9EUKA|nr:hypothetical protein TRFO_19142 [Tritrichomonas foetus]|eukprot:OHT11411.1 hypothetical protein TRFO_19142 [Tritrichomonas foetus]
MERGGYFSSFFNGRFANGSSSESDGDSFGGDSMSSFLDRIPDNNDNNNPNDGNNSNLNDIDRSNANKHVDSAVLVFGQFFRPSQISDVFLKRPGPPHNLVADRTMSLLYNNPEVTAAMNDFVKLRYRRREFPLDPFEYFMLLLMTKFHPHANEDTISRYHHFFWGGHPIDVLVRHLMEIPKHDQSVFIQAFAAQMYDYEKDFINYEFSMLDLMNASVSQHTYNWWKNSFKASDKNGENHAPNLSPSPRIAAPDGNIKELEKVESFLDQNEMPMTSFGRFSSFNDVFDVTLKCTVIGDRDPDCDINLTRFQSFEKDEDHEILALFMLKSDSCFYIENLSDKSIIVNGFEIRKDQITYVIDDSLVEFGNLSFLFNINKALISKIERHIRHSL